MTTPPAAPSASTICATAGVGTTPDIHDIDAHRRQTRRQRRLQHIAGEPGVPPDHDKGPDVREADRRGIAEPAPRRHAQVHRQRRGQVLVGDPAHAIRPEQSLLLIGSVRHAHQRGAQHPVVQHVAALHLFGDGVRGILVALGMPDRLVEFGSNSLPTASIGVTPAFCSAPATV